MKRLLKLLPVVAGICLGLLVVIDFIAGVASPDRLALDAAMAKCRAEGLPDVEMKSIHVSVGFIGSTAIVELRTMDKARPETIRVTLRKPVNVLAWQVADYQEGPHEP